MIEKIKNTAKSDNGAVSIVEATFVFPIMFIILFILIFMGNAFLIKSHVESVVNKYAVLGANYCADPMLESVQKNDAFPSLENVKTEPYRYIFGGMKDVESNISSKVTEEINSGFGSLFYTMKPEMKNGSVADYKSYVVYSTFAVQVDYEIRFPIRYLGEKTPPLVDIKSRAEVPVDDAPDFIRNTDMIIDYVEDTSFGQKVTEIFGKINQFISDFAEK